jgi:hypothetical protein
MPYCPFAAAGGSDQEALTAQSIFIGVPARPERISYRAMF